MARKHKKIPELPFRVLNGPLQGTYRELLGKIEKLDAEKLANGLPVIIRLHLQLAYMTYEATRYLCADSPEDASRIIQFIAVVPPMARSVLDGLFNTIYLSTDPAEKTRRYYRAAWKETRRDYELYKQRYKASRLWRDWLKSFRRLERLLAKEEGLSKKDYKAVDWWPIPSQMLKDKRLPVDIRHFFLYLTDWYYCAYSSEAHLSWPGLSVRGSIFLMDMRSNSDRQMAMKRKSDLIARAALLLLMTLSEVSVLFQLKLGTQLQYIWTLLLHPYEEAKELYEMRYQGLLQKCQ